MNVLVVESPGKVKSINKYLGSGYKVLASFGHIRDLPAKDGSVKPDDNFSMTWEVDAKAQKRIKDIVDAVKGADKLILATDPDREGEAISWHVLEVLKQKKALSKDIKIERVAFNAITKSAVLEAIQHPREINAELVDAYLARRALDYLVGFTLSPVLWRKLPGSRSAGRVQSVALRLVVEREQEIEASLSAAQLSDDQGESEALLDLESDTPTTMDTFNSPVATETAADADASSPAAEVQALRARVSELEQRLDAELAAMRAQFTRELESAGRKALEQFAQRLLKSCSADQD